MGEILESTRKRARTEELFTTRHNRGNSHDDERVKEILNRLSSLLKEFPELKFIIDFEHLQEHVETAVVKYVEDKETKKHEAQLLLNYRQETSSLYSLPDEVLSNCLSYVGKGHYGLVGLASKKLNKAYKAEFGNETAYLEMATSVNLANHCLNELCKSLDQKDEILKAAAVNGNLDILRAAVKDGYDLLPLVAMEMKTINPDKDSGEDDGYYDSDDEVDVYYTNDDESQYSWKPKEKVNLAKLVERGHFHVLKYLYEELHYFLGLQRYCKPAIEFGKLEILEWLLKIGIMNNGGLRIGFMEDGEDGYLRSDFDYCECAIKSGNLELLKWLQEVGGFEINDDKIYRITDAIFYSKSTEMIQYCFDLGYINLNHHCVEDAIKRTRSTEVFRKMHELGYEFSEIKKLCHVYNMEDNFEIMKFLRSISIPWGDDIMKDIVEHGTLEMIQYAHEYGCTWTTHGEEYLCLFSSDSWSLDKLNYLINNGCVLDYEHSRSSDFLHDLKTKEELGLLDYFIGKNSGFDNRLFKKLFGSAWCRSEPWFEGISYLLEKGKDVENFKSLEEVFRRRREINGMKYFHSLGLPWCLDSSRNTLFLSHIACYNHLDDVKWAYENGCKGGNLVPYIKEEREKDGIRSSALWKANRAFFEENGLLDEAFLKKNGIIKPDPKNVQEIGDAQLGSRYDVQREDSFFVMDFCSLKNLVDHGFKFSSKSEKETVCKRAYGEYCTRYSQNEDRKRLALFVGMGILDL